MICELLDDDQNALHALTFPRAELVTELARDPRRVTAALEIESTTYSKYAERRQTSADLGVVISYRDWTTHSGFERAALLQAKRLYLSRQADVFEMGSAFEAFDLEQLLGLATILPATDVVEDGRLRAWRLPATGFCRYMFYLPRPSQYASAAIESIHGHMVNRAPSWVDHPRHFRHWPLHDEWAHARDVASDPDRYVPSIVTSSLNWLIDRYLVPNGPSTIGVPPGKRSAPTAGDVWERYWDGALSLSWTLVYEMLLGHFGSEDPVAIGIARGQATTPGLEPIVPKYVLSLSIEVGTRPQG